MQYAPKASSGVIAGLPASFPLSYENRLAGSGVEDAVQVGRDEGGLSQHLSLDPFMRNYLDGAMMQRPLSQDLQAQGVCNGGVKPTTAASALDFNRLFAGVDSSSLDLSGMVANATVDTTTASTVTTPDSCLNLLRPSFSTCAELSSLGQAGAGEIWQSAMGSVDSYVKGAALAAAAARLLAQTQQTAAAAAVVVPTVSVQPSAVPATTPSTDDTTSDGREKAIVRLSERFPIDDRAKNKLRGLPELLRKRIIKEFRPGPVANGDYSRALMGFLNGFPETRDYPEVPAPHTASLVNESQLRNAVALLGGCLTQGDGLGHSSLSSVLGLNYSDLASGANGLMQSRSWRPAGKVNDRVLLKGGNALSQQQLDTFRKKYPMDERAMEYLRTSAPEVQEQCVATFRIRERLDDFSQAIIAHVRACRMITGDRTPPPLEGSICNTAAAQQIIKLAEFRSRYSFDDRTLQYMQQAGSDIISRVMIEFQLPKSGIEKDFSKSITAFVRRCKEEGEKGVGLDMPQDDMVMLDGFRQKYNFDDRCLDYIMQSNTEVRRRVLTEFQPPRGGIEGDHSKSITAFVRRCKEDDKRRCHDDDKRHSPAEAQIGAGIGGCEITNLAEFRQKFPFDDRAFEYIQQCRPEVRQRVLTEFKPSLSGSTKDYSKSITAFVRRCKDEDIRRCREAATMVAPTPGDCCQSDEQDRAYKRDRKERAFAWMDSGDEEDSSGREDRDSSKKPRVELSTEEALEDFRHRFPMDAMAFDFLCRSPKSVRHRVLKEFRPSDRGANDNYSKQLTCFVRSCLKDAHGTGSILPSAKRTMGSFSMM
mmetsp:Transcript_79277/g.156976  ORF Transcript_79277/g.156976 Transcript_79277/m.156976 type:complete len:817 (-) Transcript_79277:134-2584(-)